MRSVLHTAQYSEAGQAMLELALGISLMALVFFGADFLCSFLMARNRAEITAHAWLFKLYRDAEGTQTGEFPLIDPKHLALSVDQSEFQSRSGLTVKAADMAVQVIFHPHFEQQAAHFAGLQTQPYRVHASLLNDTWYEHPIKYGLWAAGVAKTVITTYFRAEGGDASASSGTLSQIGSATSTVLEVLGDLETFLEKLQGAAS